jgi:hypothetical protein
MVLPLIFALVLLFLIQTTDARISNTLSPSFLVLLVVVTPVKFPPLWCPLLDSQFDRYHHLLRCIWKVFYVLSSSCAKMVISPYLYISSSRRLFLVHPLCHFLVPHLVLHIHWLIPSHHGAPFLQLGFYILCPSHLK